MNKQRRPIINIKGQKFIMEKQKPVVIPWSQKLELKYWRKTGIKKGTSIYDNYWKAFDLFKYDFSGKKIVDVGCGPFGGVFYNCKDLDVTLVDYCARTYNEMNLCKMNIINGNLNKRLFFDDNIFDYAVCTNTIDHILDIQNGFCELNRILKQEGILFLYVHLRKKNQLTKGHIYVLNREIVNDYIQKSNFKIIIQKVDKDWVNGRNDREALCAVLKK